MRLHIALDDELAADLDRRVGRRRRSAFIGESIRRALDDERRWELIESAVGSIHDDGEHEWNPDPAAWVRAQRRGSVKRVG